MHLRFNQNSHKLNTLEQLNKIDSRLKKYANKPSGPAEKEGFSFLNTSTLATVNMVADGSYTVLTPMWGSLLSSWVKT